MWMTFQNILLNMGGPKNHLSSQRVSQQAQVWAKWSPSAKIGSGHEPHH